MARAMCQVHRIYYYIGKNYMCQPYYYCPKCVEEKQRTIDLERRIKKLEEKLNTQSS